MKRKSLKVIIAAAAIVTVIPVSNIRIKAENLQSHAVLLNQNPIGSAKVKVYGLRIRKDASLNSNQTSTAEYGKSYSVYDIRTTDGYTWYQIGNSQWIADNNGNWLDYNTVSSASSDTKIGSVTVKVNGLRIRTKATVSSDTTGYVQSKKSYDVYEKTSGDGYTWYRIGNNQWIADENGGWTDFSDGNTQSNAETDSKKNIGTKIGSLKVKVNGLRIRSGSGTDNSVVGSVENGKSYDVYETVQANGFSWYRIGLNQWVADQNTNWVDYTGQGAPATTRPAATSTPSPVSTQVPTVMPSDQKANVNYIGTARVVVSGLTVRSEATTSSKKVGTAVNGQVYNVIALKSNGGYTWYQIGNGQWIADTSGRWVVYTGKGESTAQKAQTTTVSRSAANPYYGGWSNCTWGAWQMVYNNLGIALPSMGNAGDWLASAQRLGYATGTEPRTGAVAVYSMHVAYVIAYEPWRPNPVEIEEGGFNGGHNIRWVSATTTGTQPLRGYIYLK